MFSVKDDSLWRTEQERNGPGYSKHGVRFVNRPAMIGQGIANGLKVVEQRISFFIRLVHYRDGIQRMTSPDPIQEMPNVGFNLPSAEVSSTTQYQLGWFGLICWDEQ